MKWHAAERPRTNELDRFCIRRTLRNRRSLTTARGRPRSTRDRHRCRSSWIVRRPLRRSRVSGRRRTRCSRSRDRPRRSAWPRIVLGRRNEFDVITERCSQVGLVRNAAARRIPDRNGAAHAATLAPSSALVSALVSATLSVFCGRPPRRRADGRIEEPFQVAAKPLRDGGDEDECRRFELRGGTQHHGLVPTLPAPQQQPGDHRNECDHKVKPVGLGERLCG